MTHGSVTNIFMGTPLHTRLASAGDILKTEIMARSINEHIKQHGEQTPGKPAWGYDCLKTPQKLFCETLWEILRRSKRGGGGVFTASLLQTLKMAADFNLYFFYQ